MNHKLVVSFDFLKLVFNFFLQVFRTDPHTIGDDRVKGNAGVGIAVDQAEIVDGNTAVNFKNLLFYLLLHLGNCGIIGFNRIHVDDGFTSEFLIQLPFNVINHVMDTQRL